jgi:hypothetical protein
MLVAIARGQFRVQMKRRTIILILTLSTIACWGQTKEQKEKEDRIKFVFDSNLPDDLYDFYNQEKIRTTYKINRDLNPFYLRGDFNGDKKTDYALAVIESGTDKKGILIYHPATKKYFLAGAGKSIPNRPMDDYSMIDAWEVSDEKIVEQGVTDLKAPKLIGEAILIQKLESSSGLIYWDGKEYRWYQQGD